MATPYKHKRSATANKVPVAADFADGEILVNTADGRAFVRKGAGVATLPNVDDNNGRYVRYDAGSQGLDTLQRTNAQANLGGTPVGRSVFAAANQAAARSAIGATTIGDALITASSATSARTAIDAPPMPTTVVGIGRWQHVQSGAGAALVIPTGGTWAIVYFGFSSTAFTIESAFTATVGAGGATAAAGVAGRVWSALAWRIA